MAVLLAPFEVEALVEAVGKPEALSPFTGYAVEANASSLLASPAATREPARARPRRKGACIPTVVWDEGKVRSLRTRKGACPALRRELA